MNHQLKILFSALAFVLLFSACRKKSDKEENEGELITTINLKFTPTTGGTTLVFTFRDLDGEGGAGPSKFDDIVLAPLSSYNLEIELLDESKSPAENISEEVKAEGDEHQLYFVPGGGVSIAVSNLDTDAGGLPLGLKSTWTTGAVSTGTVRIVLKHKPGIKSAGDAITVGDTDIDLAWPARVQ